MHRKDAIAWVVSVCSVSLRLSQAKTLAVLVASAMRVQRVSLANIGRGIIGKAKHQIKRCWRFCDNDRVETADAMRGVVKKILKKRKKPLIVAMDWVDIRGFQTLMAAAVFKGRSVPLCWASCAKHVYDGHKSRNAFEESLLLVLASMIPQGQKVILLADRGLGAPNWPASASVRDSTMSSAFSLTCRCAAHPTAASCWTIRCTRESASCCARWITASTAACGKTSWSAGCVVFLANGMSAGS